MSRIALCLSGKIGNIKGKSGYYKSNPEVLLKGYEHYKRHIIDKNNVDVFIHCWDTDLKQETLKLYNPVKSVFEKQIIFNVPKHVGNDAVRNNNHYSRWYSNKMVNEYRRQYEIENGFKYDFVMTTRFDLAFETDVIFDDLDNKYFYAGNWSAMLLNGVDIFKGGRGPLYEMKRKKARELANSKLVISEHQKNGLFLDLWFIANSDLSTEFFNLYDKLNEYTETIYKPIGENKQISSHHLIPHHLKKMCIIKDIKFKFHMYDDFPEVRRKYFGCKK